MKDKGKISDFNDCLYYLPYIYSVLEDDDVAILDLISRVGGDLTQPRGLSGSATRVPDVDSYTRDGMFLSSMEIMILDWNCSVFQEFNTFNL